MSNNPIFFFDEMFGRRQMIARPKEEQKIRDFTKQRIIVQINGNRKVGKTILFRRALKDTPHLEIDFAGVKSSQECLNRLVRALQKNSYGKIILKGKIKDGMFRGAALHAVGSILGIDPIFVIQMILDRVEKSKFEAVVIDDFQDIQQLKDPNQWLGRFRSFVQSYSKSYLFVVSPPFLFHLMDRPDSAFYKQTLKYEIPPIPKNLTSPIFSNILKKETSLLKRG